MRHVKTRLFCLQIGAVFIVVVMLCGFFLVQPKALRSGPSLSEIEIPQDGADLEEFLQTDDTALTTGALFQLVIFCFSDV